FPITFLRSAACREEVWERLSSQLFSLKTRRKENTHEERRRCLARISCHRQSRRCCIRTSRSDFGRGRSNFWIGAIGWKKAGSAHGAIPRANTDNRTISSRNRFARCGEEGQNAYRPYF